MNSYTFCVNVTVLSVTSVCVCGDDDSQMYFLWCLCHDQMYFLWGLCHDQMYFLWCLGHDQMYFLWCWS